MKKSTILCLCLFFALNLQAQLNLSSEQWRGDLKFLQQTVHQDYAFLFKKVTAEEFDAEVEKLHQAIPDLEEHEIIVGLARLVALFKYGHTTLPLSGWWDRDAFQFHQAPFNLYAFSDGVFVQGTQEAHKQALRAKVLAVEGVPIEEALNAIYPVVPAENAQFFKAFGLNYLGTPEVLHAQGITKALKTSVTLQLEKEGRTFEVTFPAVKADGFPGHYGLIQEKEGWLDARYQGTTPLYLKNLDRIYYYEYLPEQKTVYVRHSQIQDDAEQATPAFYAEVFDFIEQHEVERLVLDVRLNGGGNNYKNKPIVTGVIQCEKINQPGRFFVLLGRRTFSACQNLVNELHTYTNAVFVGEPTSENINFYGDNREVKLPNSQISTYLSFAWWQDKPQWENDDWLAPHLAVEMSAIDYMSGQDPVLQTALDFASENFVLNPMGYLTDLFMAGEIEKLQAEAARLVSDPVYSFVDFEEEFNNVGYRLMGAGQLEPALMVFGMNAQFFPDSPNCWDSLAEAHWKSNQPEKAKALYQKAISLDPDGPIGENARKMLAEMEKE